ncbi:MAG: hypothetical protein IT239_01525 [Bacteroidia bacterium]|nr:hypothetical protein [Bacteroidia bacterium]
MMNQQYTAHINNKNYTLELDANSGKINKENFELDVITENSQKAHAILKNKSYSIELVSIDEAEKKVIIKVNNNQYHVKIE